MKVKRTRHALLLALALSWQGAAWAAPTPQETLDHEHIIQPDDTLTLQQLVEQALQRDPRRDVPAAYAAEAAALQRRADSLFAGSPSVALRHQTDQVGSNKGLREWEATVELPLWRWGQQDASEQVAMHAQSQAGSVSASLRLRVAGALRDSLWSLVIAEERVALAQHAYLTAQTLQREVEKRVQAGDLAKSDLLLTQDETLSKQDELLLARAELLHAGKRYFTYTGLDRRPARFAERESPKTTIGDNHPLLLNARNRLQRAQAELQQARSAGAASPQLTLGSRREKDFITGIDENSVGIGIRLPFAGGAHSAPAIGTASRTVAEDAGELDTVQRQLDLNLHEAAHMLETLRAEQSLAEQQQRLANENLRMAHIAFDVGEMNLAQLLRVQSRAFTAERAYSLRKLQLQQAVAQYNQAVGELP